MTEKQVIRAEIERLHEEYRGKKGDSNVRRTLRTLLYFIDSLPEETVSEDLEKAGKEWLAPQLDKAYKEYGERKMMELTHFDGYAMLDAIEFGALWQRNSVWHNMDDELPEERRNVLATTASPKGRGIMEGGVTVVTDRGLLEADKKGTFKKWAYLSDLFPTDIEI